MKKIKSSIILIVVIVITVLIGYVSYKIIKFGNDYIKDTNAAEPLTKEEVLNYKNPEESEMFNIQYTVVLFDSSSDGYDNVLYEILIKNETNQTLDGFIVNAKNDNSLLNIIPIPYFMGSEIVLNGKDNEKGTETEITKITLVVSYDNLDDLHKDLFDSYIDRYFVDIRWDGGNEKILLGKENSTNFIDLRGKGFDETMFAEMLKWIKENYDNY